ncbi:MAG: ATP-binding protein, partial [bacterium]|nr:ATP-binding protein [bacterium]
PPNLFLGRDKEFHHIENTFHRNSIILLYGSQGIGKTHLAHQYAYWFAAAGKGDKAFYFNFENESFDREEILKLTGHVLDQEKATKEKTYEQFISKNFLLVIDNFMPEKNDEKLPAEKLEKLLSFFKEIAESGSRVLIISSSITESGLGDSSLINNITPILLPGLGLEDRRHLASVLLKTEQVEERGSGPEFYELLDSLQGHPFLTITLLLWLAKTDAQSIKEGIEQKAKIDGSSSSFLSLYTPEILFDFSWDKLSEIEQLFFAALADCSGFITDGLPIAFDMKDEKKKEEQENASTIKYPGQEFFELLGVEVPEATTGLITAGVRAGFLMAKPMGKEIHSAAPAYLANKRAGLSWPNDKLEKIKLLLNKIFCLELRVLAPFLARNPNPILYQQVGENHKRWFDALETVWLNKDFTLFMNSSHLLASIMHKIGMKEHLDEWYLKLIKSSTLPEPGSSLSPEASVAWLKTACDSIHARGALDSPEILKGVEFWHHWIDNDMAGYENAEYKKIIFNNIVMFLEAFYRVKKEWEGRKNISLIALNFYEEEKDYLKVITSLQSIARCYEALGSLDECKRYEEKVMNDIPYDSLDDGIKEKSMLEIAINRINRKEYSEAESLLNAVKDSSQIGELLVAADSFQGRIFMEQDRLEEAVAIFTDIWRDIMERKHQFNIESTSKNLVDLENKMGKEKFRAIFEENAPGVLTPLELVMQQQGGAPQPPEGA